MFGAAYNKSQKINIKCKKMGNETRNEASQCGKWLSLKKAIEKDEKFRAEVLDHIENILAFLAPTRTNPPTPEEERELIESREALSSHHIADLALALQPLNTCMWHV